MNVGVNQNNSKQTARTFFVLFGFTFFSGSMAVGQQMAASMSIKTFAWSVFLGGLILGMFGGALAYLSSRFHVDLFSMSTPVFGNTGRKVLSVLILSSQVGWFGVGMVMFSKPIAKYLGFDGFAETLLAVLMGCLMIFSAFGGIKYIARVSYIAVPFILVFGMVAIFTAARSVPVTEAYGIEIEKGVSTGLSTGISLVVGTYIAGAITVPNFTENNDSPLITGVIAFLAFSVGNGVMLVFGAASYYLVGGSDIFDIFTYFRMLGIGIIVLGLNIWSSCDNGLYSASLGLRNLTGISMKTTVLICGTVGIALSRFVYDNLMQYLVIMNHIFPPIGIMIIVATISRKYGFLQDRQMHVSAIAAVIIGTIASFLLRGVGIESLNGVFVSIWTYLVIWIIITIFRKRSYHNG